MHDLNVLLLRKSQRSANSAWSCILLYWNVKAGSFWCKQSTTSINEIASVYDTVQCTAIWGVKPPQYYNQIDHAVEHNSQQICTAITLLHIYTFLLDNLKKIWCSSNINIHGHFLEKKSLYVPHSVLSDAHFHWSKYFPLSWLYLIKLALK